MIFQQQITVTTQGRTLHDISLDIRKLHEQTGVRTGLCNLFLQHTSASLILCENADPDVQIDLEAFVQRLVPDGDPLFRHILEGSDDMAAHIRTVLTDSSLVIPISDGQLALGVWQGIYLWEHRYAAHNRRLIVTIQGE